MNTHTYLTDEEATVCISTNDTLGLLLRWNNGDSSSDHDDTLDTFELDMEVTPECSNTSEPTGKSGIHK